MLVNRGTPERVDIPHEPGEWLEFFKPSWKQLRQSRSQQEKASREVAKEFGADFLAALTAGGEEGESRARRAVEASENDPSRYDTESLLAACVHDWSYRDEAGAPIEVTVESIGQLDSLTATWAMQHLLDASLPPTEEESKN